MTVTMKRRFNRNPSLILCPLLALVILLSPTLAISATMVSASANHEASSRVVPAPNAELSTLAVHPLQMMTLLPGITTVEEARLAAARFEIARQMIALDYPPAEAQALAAELTSADLEVLLANSRMLQRAGGMPSQTVILIIILVVVIVAISVAGSGSVSIF